ncbi:MAG: extracellular solute-binding protein [bacterium]|nr:extracellular solute-binding protein [bacterium]
MNIKHKINFIIKKFTIKKIKIQRTFFIFLVSISLIFLLIFSSVIASGNDKKEISILLGGGLQGWDTVIKEFEKETGIKVKVVVGPPTTDSREMMYSISFLTKEQSYDLVYLDVVWLGKFASANWLENIKNFIDPTEYFTKNNIFKNYVDSLTYKGQYYAIPVKADAGLLYYRKDLLNKYKLTPPKTYYELKEQAKYILKMEKELYNNSDLIGFVFQGKQYEGLVCNFYEILRGFGYELIDLDSNNRYYVKVKEEQLEEVLNFMKSLIEEGVTPKSVITYEEEESRIAFSQGKVIFARNWPYAIKLLQENNEMKDKYGVSVLPGNPPAPTVGGWALAVSSYSKNKQEAFKFIDFVVNKGLKELFLKRGDIPTKADLFNDIEIINNFPYSDVVLESLKYSKSRTIHPLYPKISNVIQVYVSGVLSFKYNPKYASKEIIKNIQKILDTTNY